MKKFDFLILLFNFIEICLQKKKRMTPQYRVFD